jgi:hypothetical protein
MAPGGEDLHASRRSALLTPRRRLTEPREGNKPEPLGNASLLILATTCTLGLLYLLWRRASNLRSVVSHQQVSRACDVTWP